MTDSERKSRVAIDFYSTEACTISSRKDITSSTDGGCVYIGALGLQANGKKAFQSFAAASPGELGTQPFTDEEKERYPGVDDRVTGHGQYWKSSEGKIWRYQQIAEGIWQGVPAEDWDDSVHLKYDGPLESLASNVVEDGLEDVEEL